MAEQFVLQTLFDNNGRTDDLFPPKRRSHPKALLLRLNLLLSRTPANQHRRKTRFSSMLASCNTPTRLVGTLALIGRDLRYH